MPKLSHPKPRHILLIPSWYKSATKPLAGTFFEEQARALQKCGYKVSVLYPKRCGFIGKAILSSTPPPMMKSDDNGLPTYQVAVYNIIPHINQKHLAGLAHYLNRMIIRYQSYWAYKKVVNFEGKPDIIHSHSAIWGGVVGKYLSKKSGSKHIITEHSSRIGHHRSRIMTHIIGEVYRNSHHVVAVSSSLRNLMIDRYAITPSRIIAIPNVVHPVFLHSPSLKSYSKPFKFIIIGHLLPNKNHHSLFKAMQSLVEQGHDVHLDVVGYGPLRKELDSFITIHQLQRHIKILGSKTRAEVSGLIKDSHAVISTSHQETFGVTLIEALASGRPIVSTASGGPEDIVKPTNGILIPGSTVQDISSAMIQMIENYSEYDQELIRKEAIQMYSEDAVIEKLMQLYNDLVYPSNGPE